MPPGWTSRALCLLLPLRRTIAGLHASADSARSWMSFSAVGRRRWNIATESGRPSAANAPSARMIVFVLPTWRGATTNM